MTRHQPAMLRPEAGILLLCARGQLQGEQCIRLDSLLRAPLDWDYIIRKASWHGLLPLLYWNLRKTNRDAIPADIWARLASHFQWNTQRCLLLTAELFKILDLFGQNGIKTCPFKGPLLAAAWYGNIGLRSFGDLDILVPRHDIRRAVEILGKLKYSQPTLSDDIDPESIGYLQPHYYTLTRNTFSLGNVRVDLQWRISETHFAFVLDSDDCWAQLESIPILNRQVSSFALDDLFLILSVHGCKHYWYRIKWICDIAEILRATEGHDWSACLTKAKQLGVERSFKLGVYLAKTLLQAPVPVALLAEVEKDARVIRNARWITERLFVERDGRISEKRAFIFYLDMKDRWSDRIRHCLLYVWQFVAAAITPTQIDRAAVRLPNSLQFLHYVIRPLRLSLKHAHSALRRARHSLMRPRPA